jgi:hypothetical protein
MKRIEKANRDLRGKINNGIAAGPLKNVNGKDSMSINYNITRRSKPAFLISAIVLIALLAAVAVHTAMAAAPSVNNPSQTVLEMSTANHSRVNSKAQFMRLVSKSGAAGAPKAAQFQLAALPGTPTLSN